MALSSKAEQRLPWIVTISLHTLAIAALVFQWNFVSYEPLVITPQAIQASLVQTQAAKPKSKPKAEPKPTKEAVVPEKAPKKVEQPAKAKPVESTPKPLDLDLEDEAEISSELEQIEQELQQAEINAVRQDQAMKYAMLIKTTVEAVWRKPPSYSLGAEVALRIRLLPDGTVDTVDVEKSSGNNAFDESALVAVRKVARLPVPESVDLFREYFRSFVLVFSPDGEMSFENNR
jgi:TonB family protein